MNDIIKILGDAYNPCNELKKKKKFKKNFKNLAAMIILGSNLWFSFTKPKPKIENKTRMNILKRTEFFFFRYTNFLSIFLSLTIKQFVIPVITFGILILMNYLDKPYLLNFKKDSVLDCVILIESCVPSFYFF
jgi:hypothetical protein